MTAITAKTEPRAISRGSQTTAKAGACTLGATLAASHVESIKRFCKVALMIALMLAAAVGVVALKSAIWISHFNY